MAWKALFHISSNSACLETLTALLGDGYGSPACSSPCLPAGVAPLHVAAREGQLPALELLVSKGANLEMKDGHGWTALQASYLGEVAPRLRVVHRATGGSRHVRACHARLVGGWVYALFTSLLAVLLLQVARKFDQSDAEGVLLRAGAADPGRRAPAVLLRGGVPLPVLVAAAAMNSSARCTWLHLTCAAAARPWLWCRQAQVAWGAPGQAARGRRGAEEQQRGFACCCSCISSAEWQRGQQGFGGI